MKPPSRITFFLISSFSFFFMGSAVCFDNFSYHLEANPESLVIEEQREVYLAIQEIFEVTPEISGGHPDTVTDKSATEASTLEVVIISSHDIKSKYISECSNLGKIPLYLRYQALQLHC